MLCWAISSGDRRLNRPSGVVVGLDGTPVDVGVEPDAPAGGGVLAGGVDAR